MNHSLFLALLGLALAACTAETPEPERRPVVAAADTVPDRTVAVTFDDLPAVALGRGTHCDRAALEGFTDRLLDEIGDVPTTGFVVEEQVCDEGTLRADLLTRWLEAGHTLGNHTAQHRDLNKVSASEYTEGIVQGEATAAPLLRARGDSLRYFRYPYLHAGDTVEKKETVEAFLDERGYTVAPVTFDNDEWVFARAYLRAAERGDSTLMAEVGPAYVSFMEDVAAHFETWSAEVVGYEPPQILLVHANLLNADYFAEVAAMLRRRGYRFVTLDEAMRDPIHTTPNGYVGENGPSWLHRWALDAGREIEWEPGAPEWVWDLYRSE